MSRDPGDQDRRRGARRPGLKAPEPASLFDISDQPPPTAMRVSSPTSIEAAAEMPEDQRSLRREAVFRAIVGAGKDGIARFRIAERLAVPDHWVSSSVDALVKMRRVEEVKDRWDVNPKSGKKVGVLVAIESAEETAA